MGQHDLEAALIAGGTVKAICGYEFNPKVAWPEGLPLCPRCKAILEASP